MLTVLRRHHPDVQAPLRPPPTQHSARVKCDELKSWYTSPRALRRSVLLEPMHRHEFGYGGENLMIVRG